MYKFWKNIDFLRYNFKIVKNQSSILKCPFNDKFFKNLGIYKLKFS